jgi:4-hydroxybenzoate polyprenyltransferase
MRSLHALIYSNVFVALVLTSLTTSSYFLIPNIAFNWVVPASVFLGSFTLYNFHRLYKIDFIPKLQRGERHIWMQNHGGAIKIGMGLAVFFAMLLLPNYNADNIVWLVPAAIISVGYTIPFIPTENKWWRLRDIPLAKPFIIALVVTYLTLAFPVFVESQIQDILKPDFLTLFLERAVFILAVTIPFEMRDVFTDKDAGLETLATYLGFENAKKASFLISTLWFCLWAWRYSISMNFRALGLGLICFVILLLAAKSLRANRSEIYFVLLFEGLIILYAALVMATGLL